MSKLRLLRKAFSFLIMVAVFLCISIPAYASGNIQPRAISEDGSSPIKNAMIRVKKILTGRTSFSDLFKPKIETLTNRLLFNIIVEFNGGHA